MYIIIGVTTIILGSTIYTVFVIIKVMIIINIISMLDQKEMARNICMLYLSRISHCPWLFFFNYPVTFIAKIPAHPFLVELVEPEAKNKSIIMFVMWSLQYSARNSLFHLHLLLWQISGKLYCNFNLQLTPPFSPPKFCWNGFFSVESEKSCKN